MATTKHTFYAVSTGPSDSRYLTQEAIAVIKSCNTIFYPITLNSPNPNIAFNCIKQAVDFSTKNCVGVTFSMSRDVKTTEQEYETVVKQVSQALTHGDAAFIAIGDISIYSTAARVANLIQSKGMNTKFISGVPSFCVAAGSLKLDLAQTDEEIRIIPGDAYIKNGKIDRALESEGTKIIMKSARHLKDIINKIEQKNLLNYASLVHNAGYENEKIFQGAQMLSIPEDLFSHAYMSIIIIKMP